VSRGPALISRPRGGEFSLLACIEALETFHWPRLDGTSSAFGLSFVSFSFLSWMKPPRECSQFSAARIVQYRTGQYW